MNKGTCNIVFAGIGGQGIILASDMMTEAAFRAGFDVKKSELHGMSQRGGSVSSDVRFGEKVFSPMIPKGEGDCLIVFSEDQVEVCRAMGKPDAAVLTPALLKDFNPGKSLNIAMMGIFCAVYGWQDLTIWETLIRETFRKPEMADANLEVFHKGLELGKEYKKGL